MIFVFLLIFYRYSATVTQYGKYHLFPSFSSPIGNFNDCETDVQEISHSSNQINSSSSNGFGILLNFCCYPSVFNVERQIGLLSSINNFSNFSLKYNYTYFTQAPVYPIVINAYNRTSKYRITITCARDSSGMDLRDKFRQYYLPCLFLLFTPMLIAAFHQAKGKNLRIICILICFIYFLSIFLRYLSLMISKLSYEVNKKYVNSYHLILTADIFSSFMRVFSFTLLLSISCHPAFAEKDFSIKDFSITIFILNFLFELVNCIFFVDLFPYLEKETISKKYFSWLSSSFENIKILYWSMFSVFPIEIIIIIIKVLRFLPKNKSKFIRRTVKGTMWLIIVISYILYISGKLGVYFAMINGGFSALTNLIVDSIDFFFPSLIMGAIFHFEKSRQFYSEKLRNRRQRRNQPLSNNQDKNKKRIENNELLNGSATNYTQMNEPLLFNSFESNNNNNS